MKIIIPQLFKSFIIIVFMSVIPLCSFGVPEKDGPQEIENETCLDCHEGGMSSSMFGVGNPGWRYYREFGGTISEIDSKRFENSVHSDVKCVECHTDATETHADDDEFKLDKVKCYACHEHEETLAQYKESVHGEIFLNKKGRFAPSCSSCHGSHYVTKPDSPESLVNPANISKTCGNCHPEIAKQLKNSIHGSDISRADKKLPVCNDCHTSHNIQLVNQSDLRLDMLGRCGNCHEKEYKTFSTSYHGKASSLGGAVSAKCHDCHGSHNILPDNHPDSALHAGNILKTCRECHSDAQMKFTQYMPHSDYHDKENYPVVFYVFLAMRTLIIVVFSFFSIHTILWIVRMVLDRGKTPHPKIDPNEPWVRRFDSLHIATHIMVIISFLSLAVTGMVLKFADSEIAIAFVKNFGGVETMGVIHRLGAMMAAIYSAIHLGYIARKFFKGEITFKGLFTKDYSLIPSRRDFKDLKRNLLYFIGKGEKPSFGRWTYWEKFEYLGEFWGVLVVAITGVIMWVPSGLLLLFPETATLMIPGYWINIATVIHSNEALLAVGVIFCFHFFHTHLKPGKFPMDTVIFTGGMPLSEFKEERPLEYQALLESGELEGRLMQKPSKDYMFWAKLYGFTALSIGLITIGAIIYSSLFTG